MTKANQDPSLLTHMFHENPPFWRVLSFADIWGGILYMCLMSLVSNPLQLPSRVRGLSQWRLTSDYA